MPTHMKAIVYEKYGAPEVLKFKQIPVPQPRSGEVLIRVKATAVNAADWRLRKADPFMVRLFFGLLRPKQPVLGMAFSGVVADVGPGVSEYKPGDEVFGLDDMGLGCNAEYKCMPSQGPMSMKPQSLSHEETAVLPFGLHTAYHFFKKASINNGNRILIYGASGSVGTAAVQLAKYYGAHVTAVCSTVNIEMVKQLGADTVIDYTQQDIASWPNNFDIVMETVNKIPLKLIAAKVKKGGILIPVAGMIKEGLQSAWLARTAGIKILTGAASTSATDMVFFKELAENGSIKPVIDRSYMLEQLVEAHQYVEQGHKKGNVSIIV